MAKRDDMEDSKTASARQDSDDTARWQRKDDMTTRQRRRRRRQDGQGTARRLGKTAWQDGDG
jgi:hypothetical protein